MFRPLISFLIKPNTKILIFFRRPYFIPPNFQVLPLSESSLFTTNTWSYLAHSILPHLSRILPLLLSFLPSLLLFCHSSFVVPHFLFSCLLLKNLYHSLSPHQKFHLVLLILYSFHALSYSLLSTSLFVLLFLSLLHFLFNCFLSFLALSISLFHHLFLSLPFFLLLVLPMLASVILVFFLTSLIIQFLYTSLYSNHFHLSSNPLYLTLL